MKAKRSFFEKDRVHLFAADAPLPPFIPHLGWVATHQAGRVQPTHRHENRHEIGLIARGKVLWRIDGKTFELGGGDAYVLPPGTQHGGVDKVMHPSETYWLEVAIDAPGFSVAYPFEKVFAHLARHPGAVFKTNADAAALFKRIIEECRSPLPFSLESTTCLAFELLILMIRSPWPSTLSAPSQGNERARVGRVDAALAWIEENLSEEFCVADAAATCGLRPSRFHELFVEATGFTPREHVARRRVERAKRMLTETSMSITDVAFRLGFNSAQYFATVFKKYTAETPSRFRKKKELP